ncbi:hypothetical protein IIE18_11090 [Pseudomonas sp. V1]|uniref:CheR family methyltransferase n=1 Tax=Pseudomonas arcuscaelestis TaxID=2710591 RepID=UPI00193FCF39|nr:CheR family methyltransferase [Pseudomonas arcuscaelestis]MBM3105685.1 hypothetical protein [Pseudomonas arcuscaelestis]
MNTADDLKLDEEVANSWVRIIEERFAIEIDEFRLAAFTRALTSFACETGEELEGLLKLFVSGQLDEAQRAYILHLATNHETRFFRYPPSLAAITEVCANLRRPPRVLSVGCSTGEEPYSIACSLLRAGHAGFTVHGTDVSQPCIDKARQGIYRGHPDLRADVAAPHGPNRIRFHAWVRDMVTFEQHNILAERPVNFPAPDVIITQNMLIYYRVETRHLILQKLAAMLPVGGHLITGPAEDGNWNPMGLKRMPNHLLNLFVRVA